MRWINAPLLGRRPVTEFTISGLLEAEPETIEGCEPGQWVFDRNSLPIVRTEWWFHSGSQFWFLVERNTMTDEVSDVQLAREIAKESTFKRENELTTPPDINSPETGGSN